MDLMLMTIFKSKSLKRAREYVPKRHRTDSRESQIVILGHLYCAGVRAKTLEIAGIQAKTTSRIMDLNQYLDRMSTKTIIIRIQRANKCGIWTNAESS